MQNSRRLIFGTAGNQNLFAAFEQRYATGTKYKLPGTKFKENTASAEKSDNQSRLLPRVRIHCSTCLYCTTYCGPTSFPIPVPEALTCLAGPSRTIASSRSSAKAGWGSSMRLRTPSGRHVALKFLTPAMGGDATLLQRFQREARAASVAQSSEHLHDPRHRAVRVRHFIVMELLDGESLADRIRRGPLDVDSLLDARRADCGRARIRALQRNRPSRLKPANIFITSRGQAKILDFGIAKIDRREKPRPLPRRSMTIARTS